MADPDLAPSRSARNPPNPVNAEARRRNSWWEHVPRPEPAPMTTALERLAGRVTDDPFFLGSALARDRIRHGLTDEQLADRLGCDLETLARVALCRLPRADRFVEDCRAIAEAFGVRVEVVEDAAWPW